MDTRDSLVLDATDLGFCLYDWLDAESLTCLDRFSGHNRDTFDGMLDLSRQLAEDLFAPHNRTGDLNEPKLVDGRVRLIDEVGPALDAFAARRWGEAAELFEVLLALYPDDGPAGFFLERCRRYKVIEPSWADPTVIQLATK